MDEIDRFAHSESCSLATVAKDNSLFVRRKTAFDVNRLPLEQLTHLLVVVRYLLHNFLQTSLRPGPKLVLGGAEVLVDETYAANLEHLLLCLQAQLLHLLVASCLALVADCQRDQDRHCREWASEFPNAKRPLNTTWPWSIRPSLAILWGVCWMFYDHLIRLDSHGNAVDMQGNILVPREVVQQYRDGLRWQRDTNQQLPGFAPPALTASGLPNMHPPHVPSTSSGNHTELPSDTHAQYAFAAESAAPQWLPGGPSIDVHDSAYLYPADRGVVWLPPHSISQQQPAFGVAQRQPLPQHSRSGGTPTPTIRVTTDFSGRQPQDPIYSASSASPLPPDNYPPFNNYPTGHLSPQRPPYMPQEGSEMQTPVSPVSAHDTSTLDHQLQRKRSHSSMMSQPEPTTLGHEHSRSGSVASVQGASAGEDYSPRGSRAFKRGDPPTNPAGKYTCDYADECRNVIFDRKCEWSKHMDKHDRPYRCPHTSCAKLQGFTYSGGLLRHEREVHNKHGGPKAQLMCPHADCKRHSGKGFTRKENLNEHLRRVHAMKDSQSEMPILRQDGVDAVPGAEEGETPASFVAELEEYAQASPALGKRKRSTMESVEQNGLEGFEDPAQEAKRLRAENEYKDIRIRKLEEDSAAQNERLRQLEEVLGQLQQNHQHEQPQEIRS